MSNRSLARPGGARISALAGSRALRALIVSSFVATLSGAVAASELPISCGTLATHYGPYDYRVDTARLPIVEKHHFTPEMERLAHRGSASQIEYTLRAFPNHHRALMSLMRLGEKTKSERPGRLTITVECFMLRAEHFAPEDPVVRMISGVYYLKRQKPSLAIERLEIAQKLGSSDPNLLYNLGLAYLDLGDKPKALDFAHQALAAGFPLEGLKNRLKRAGAWREPTVSHGRPETPAPAAE